MGYGIYVTGNAAKRSLFGFGQGSGNMIESVRGAIDAKVTDPLQRRLMHWDEEEDKLTLQLHPSAEDVEISLNDGDVLISAKTSSAGPGYHAMLVDLLDQIAPHAKVVLSWEGQGEGGADETGYHEHRDMELLRGETIRWLRTISRHIAEAGEDSRDWLLNMPIGDRAICDAFALAPMGEFPREWFLSVCDADDKEIIVMAESFFTAWHGPNRAEYWANIGRYLMLWDLDWTAPIKDAERAPYETMLACYDRARQMDPAVTVPEDEIREARELFEGGDPAVPPRAGGAGYRRGMMERPLNVGWSANIPGYFRREQETDGERQQNYFWFADREIHYTVLSFNSAEGGTSAADFVLRNTKAEEGKTVLPFTPKRHWLTAEAIVESSDGFSTIQAMYGVTWKDEQRALALTLVHEGGQDGQDWAKAFLESVSHPKPDSD